MYKVLYVFKERKERNSVTVIFAYHFIQNVKLNNVKYWLLLSTDKSVSSNKLST